MPDPRILFLSPEHPDPEGNGGEVRLFRVLRELGRRGLDVTLIAPAHIEKIERGSALRDDGIEMRSVRRPASPGREAAEVVLTDPRVGFALLQRSWLAWQAEVYRSELRPVLAAAYRELWDGVVIEHDWAIEWAHGVPEGIPVGLTFHNVTGELLQYQADTASNILSRLGKLRDVRLVRGEMARGGRRLSRAFACSDDDARSVERRWGVPTDVVPNGTDVARLAGVGHDDEIAGRIVFTGTMSYPPNAQAAAWFVRDVLPLVRRRRPDATVQIAGGGVGPETAALAEIEGVEVTGRVPSLDPYLAGAQVVVAPLLAGGGTKLKVLEALAAGRAVVATTVGAEGIAVEDRTHLRVADGAEAFAAAVVELLEDPTAAHAMAERGRERVAAHYDWAAIGGRMDAALRDWLAV